MKSPFYLALFVIALTLTSVAYPQVAPSNPILPHLPVAADHIYEANLAGLMGKADLMALLNKVPPTANAHSKLVIDALKDPAGTGLDLTQHLFFTQVTATGLGADTLSYSNIFLALSDSAKFRTTLGKAIPGLHYHHVAGKGISTGKEKMGLAWNDRLAVITLISIKKIPILVYAKPGDPHPLSVQPHANAATPHLTERAESGSLAALAGPPASPWTTDQRFLTGFASNDDLHGWSTGSAGLAKTFSKLGTKMFANHIAVKGSKGSPLQPAADSNRNPVLSTLNFANGRIVINTTTFADPADADIYRRVLDRPVNPDLVTRLPNGSLLGWAGLHLNLSAVGDLMEKFHALKSVDSALDTKSLKIADFAAALTGDLLVAAIAPTPGSAPDTAKKKPTWYFVVGLNDPTRLWQIAGKLSLFKDSAVNTAPDTTRKSNPFKDLGSKFVIRDNLLVISGSREKAQRYFDHTDRRPAPQSDAEGNWASITIDLKTLSGFLGNSLSGDPKAMIAGRVLEKMDRLTISAGNMQGNNIQSSIQLIMADPSTNSLSTLLSIMH